MKVPTLEKAVIRKTRKTLLAATALLAAITIAVLGISATIPDANAHSGGNVSHTPQVSFGGNSPTPAPQNLRVTGAHTETSVTLTYSGGTGLTDMQYGIRDIHKSRTLTWHTLNTTTKVVSGLTPYQYYAIRVRGMDSDDVWHQSNYVNVRTQADPPPKPTYGQSSLKTESNRIEVIWSQPKEPTPRDFFIGVHEVGFHSDGEYTFRSLDTDRLDVSDAGNSRVYKYWVEGLSPGTDYRFKVRVRRWAGSQTLSSDANGYKAARTTGGSSISPQNPPDSPDPPPYPATPVPWSESTTPPTLRVDQAHFGTDYAEDYPIAIHLKWSSVTDEESYRVYFRPLDKTNTLNAAPKSNAPWYVAARVDTGPDPWEWHVRGRDSINSGTNRGIDVRALMRTRSGEYPTPAGVGASYAKKLEQGDAYEIRVAVYNNADPDHADAQMVVSEPVQLWIPAVPVKGNLGDTSGFRQYPSVAANRHSEVILKWDSQDARAFTKWEIYRKKVGTFHNYALLTSFTPTDVTYSHTDTTVEADTSYTYKLRLVAPPWHGGPTSGDPIETDGIRVDVPTPQFPPDELAALGEAGLRVLPLGPNGRKHRTVKLQWNWVPQYTAQKIFLVRNGPIDFQLRVDDQATTTVTEGGREVERVIYTDDTRLAPDSEYTYWLRVLSSNGAYQRSQEVTTRTQRAPLSVSSTARDNDASSRGAYVRLYATDWGGITGSWSMGTVVWNGETRIPVYPRPGCQGEPSKRSEVKASPDGSDTYPDYVPSFNSASWSNFDYAEMHVGTTGDARGAQFSAKVTFTETNPAETYTFCVNTQRFNLQ